MASTRPLNSSGSRTERVTPPVTPTAGGLLAASVPPARSQPARRNAHTNGVPAISIREKEICMVRGLPGMSVESLCASPDRKKNQLLVISLYQDDPVRAAPVVTCRRIHAPNPGFPRLVAV